ncbi:MAG TPA: matrixin family metalloprotease [Candidatus Aquicultor sp.]
MLKRKILVILIAVTILLAMCAPANAYTILAPWNYFGGYMYIYYAWGSSMPSTSVWKDAFKAAATDWTNTPTELIYSYSSSAININKLGIVSISGGAYGYTYSNITNGKTTSFSAVGNTATTGSFTATMRRSTAGHELGHGAGLGEGNVAQSIMYQNRDRSKIYIPQVDDVNGITYMYH